LLAILEYRVCYTMLGIRDQRLFHPPPAPHMARREHRGRFQCPGTRLSGDRKNRQQVTTANLRKENKFIAGNI